jgi:hypothetical protein
MEKITLFRTVKFISSVSSSCLVLGDCWWDCQIALKDESGGPLSVSFHHGFPWSRITWRMNERPVDGRSSETQAHPIDMIYRSIN